MDSQRYDQYILPLFATRAVIEAEARYPSTNNAIETALTLLGALFIGASPWQRCLNHDNAEWGDLPQPLARLEHIRAGV
jgi:hypothetical protein